MRNFFEHFNASYCLCYIVWPKILSLGRNEMSFWQMKGVFWYVNYEKQSIIQTERKLFMDLENFFMDDCKLQFSFSIFKWTRRISKDK